MINFRRKVKLATVALLGLIVTIGLVGPSFAQQPQKPNGFLYEVQRGDTLVLIALHYNIPLADVALANRLTNPNLVFPGQRLLLPGVTPPVEPIMSQLPPLEAAPHIVQTGESLYSIATQHNVTVGALTLVNNLVNPDVIQAGQTLQIPISPPEPKPLEAPFMAVTLSEPVISQGRTLALNVTLSESVSLRGTFEGHPLFFKDTGNNQMWTIIGIHALANPNLYPITLTAMREDGTTVSTFINVQVIEGPYGTETIELDEQRGALLSEDLIEQEQKKLVGLWSQLSPQPRWDGPFNYPIASETLRITSDFGTRRSYNGAPVTTFHGGVDFGGGVGIPIYAPAPGRVVLAETLTLRGNAVLIDHGLGLFSGYWHQSQIMVEVGQEVQTGDLIGYIGNTGLVTGPHLHWEMRLQGIAVDPLQWVQQAIP